ncbi:MAG: hypothetical protein NW217_04060 [Hyphomicrobiaceae bacterium]|nr:hypothetical protein [Hyphomicrobiaceae bacterium]
MTQRSFSRSATRIGAGLAFTTLLGLSAIADPATLRFDGKITDVFGHRVVVETASGKQLVNFGPKAGEMKQIVTGAAVTVEGELKKSGEVHAHKLTIGSDEIILAKDKATWRGWLLGDANDDKPFNAADAKTKAKTAGYELVGDLTADKQHFVGQGKKGNDTFVIHVHRDDVKEIRKL